MGTVEVATKPREFTVSTTQVPPLTTARPVPVLVDVDALGAEQLAGAPPPEPAQDQVQGEPGVADAGAVPCVQRPVVGTKAVAGMVAHTPLTAAAAKVPVTVQAAVTGPAMIVLPLMVVVPQSLLALARE